MPILQGTHVRTECHQAILGGGVIEDVHRTPIIRKRWGQIANTFTSTSKTSPQKLAGVAIHALDAFGPVVGTDNQVRTVGADAVEKGHGASAKTPIGGYRRWPSGPLLPA